MTTGLLLLVLGDDSRFDFFNAPGSTFLPAKSASCWNRGHRRYCMNETCQNPDGMRAEQHFSSARESAEETSMFLKHRG
ncbi:MAG: hypothetical protein DMG31_19050 [Acidobacteria bacterium]|nr:MAG: hypothetical protein DMG31_19050 [Acidobacteriota bacterium]